MPQIQRLWVNLSIAITEGNENEGVFERLSIPPWLSTDKAVIEAWLELTSPEDLADLLAWGNGDLNPRAREFTDRAIEACLAAGSGDAPGLAGTGSQKTNGE